MIKHYLKRYLPLLVLLLGLFAFGYFGWYQYFNLTTLKQHHLALLNWTTHHYLLAPCLYVLIYIAMVAICIPTTIILTLIGGYLFGLLAGTLYVIFSATIGATLLFMATQSAIGPWLAQSVKAQKAKGWVVKMHAGFNRNAFNYILALHLIPIFPFALINVAAACLNVRITTFITATFLGIIPYSFIYVSLGNSLSTLFAMNEMPGLYVILTPPFLIPLSALALLSLLPVFTKHY